MHEFYLLSLPNPNCELISCLSDLFVPGSSIWSWVISIASGSTSFLVDLYLCYDCLPLTDCVFRLQHIRAAVKVQMHMQTVNKIANIITVSWLFEKFRGFAFVSLYWLLSTIYPVRLPFDSFLSFSSLNLSILSILYRSIFSFCF